MRSRISILLLAPFFLTTAVHAVAPNTVVATIPVGVTPAGIAVTPNNLYAYVANNNNYGIAGSDSVSVLNLTNNTVLTTINDPSFNQPYTVSINPVGTKAYISNSNSSTVTVIDIRTNTVSAVITGFDGPSGMAITPDGLTGYVNNYGGPGGVGSGNGTTVRVVNLVTNSIVGPAITVGQAPAALAMTPDGKFVYVINYIDGNPGDGTVSVISTATNSVVATIPGGFSGPFGIAITPNGKFAYITNFGSNNFAPYGTTVSVVSIATNTIVATVNLGIQPAGVAITPDGKLAYATNYNTLYAGASFTDLTAGEGTVEIINTANNSVMPPIIAVGQSPANIAISPNGEFAYVTNFTSNTVKVIALQSFYIMAQGARMQNRFLTQADLVNKLTWTVTGTSLPVYYSIYRDADLTDLAGVVPASQSLVFVDHNVSANKNYTYYVVGTNRVGTTSVPVVITL